MRWQCYPFCARVSDVGGEVFSFQVAVVLGFYAGRCASGLVNEMPKAIDGLYEPVYLECKGASISGMPVLRYPECPQIGPNAKDCKQRH